MHIHEVESKVGLSQKSIRYYEENGLLCPVRNRENDYRIYTDEDILKLKKIKFLRDLGVPIRDLKLLNSKDLSLRDCILERIEKIEKEKSNYEKVKNICLEVLKTDSDFDNMNISEYSRVMNVLLKEGFTLRDEKVSKNKKIWGAVLSSLAFGAIFIFMIAASIYFQVTDEAMPWFFFTFMMVVFGFPLIAIGANLVSRIKEILGGEEDEASKY